MDQYVYPGQELEIFESAQNWKAYFGQMIIPYIKGRVLEAGAGIGSTTRVLNQGTETSWTMLEPDTVLFDKLQDTLHTFPANTLLKKGSIADAENTYDTILYIDVLEHIEADKEEIRIAAGKLVGKGHLVVLSPAYMHLYSSFDKAIGHYRRYTKRSIKKLTPESLQLVEINYMDSMGYFASLMNRIILKQSYPTKKQVEIWDRNLIPASRFMDPITGHSFGKSILAVWQKQ